MSKADRHDAGAWRHWRFQSLGHRPARIREIDDERAAIDECEHVDECARKWGVDARLINDERLRWCHQVSVVDHLPSPISRFDAVSDGRQFEMESITYQLSGHEPHRNRPRVIAIGLGLLTVRAAGVGEVPDLDGTLPSNQPRLARGTDAAAGETGGHVAYANEPLVRFAQREGNEGDVHRLSLPVIYLHDAPFAGAQPKQNSRLIVQSISELDIRRHGRSFQ